MFSTADSHNSFRYMKRYKDCALVCKYGQPATELLDLVMQVCSKKGYQVDRYSAMTVD